MTYSKDKKRLIFGVSGTVLTEDERSFFTENPVSGFILFSRNINSSSQLRKLVSELKAMNDPIIFIDQEGGRVSRLKPPITVSTYPSAEYFGALYSREKEVALSYLRSNYAMMTEELISLGIDSPCCPVADLRYTDAHSVIGDRSFGSSASEVTALCSAAIDGIDSAGGIPVVKHIPGHGRATRDSHAELPYVTASISELESTDFKVFKDLSIKPNLRWAMTAHVIFTALDEELPVTISNKAISFIRKNIGFHHNIITDDIGMLALHNHINFEGLEFDSLYKLQEEAYSEIRVRFLNSLAEVAIRAFDAGCDYVLHCNGNLEQMRIIYAAT